MPITNLEMLRKLDKEHFFNAIMYLAEKREDSVIGEFILGWLDAEVREKDEFWNVVDELTRYSEN